MTISNHSDFENTRGHAVTTIDELTVGRWYQASLSDGFDTRIIYVQLAEKREDMQMLIFKPCEEDEAHTFLGSDLWVNYSCIKTYDIHKFKEHPDRAIVNLVAKTAGVSDQLYRARRTLEEAKEKVRITRNAYHAADQECDAAYDEVSRLVHHLRDIAKV